jgi:hypothetical protein
MEGKLVALPAAVVPTVTITGVAVLPETLTDAGTLQVGAGVAAGERLHVRATVPLKGPLAANSRLNDALCPAEIVDELELPDAMLMVKSDGVTVELITTNTDDSELSMMRSGLPSPFISAT